MNLKPFRVFYPHPSAKKKIAYYKTLGIAERAIKNHVVGTGRKAILTHDNESFEYTEDDFNV